MKYFTLILLFSFSSIIVSGQNHFIGLKSGYSWTNISTNAFAIHETQPGFAAGLTYDFVNNKKFSLGTELLYERRGYINELIFTDAIGNPTGEKYKLHFYYSYLCLPIKFGYSVGNQFFGFGNIGICPAILQQATATFPVFNSNIEYTGDSSVSGTGNLSKFDIAGLAEIGCGYKISERIAIEASVRYQHSFTSLTNEDFFKNYFIRNYGMTLSLGAKYNLTYKSSSKNKSSVK